MEINKIYHEKCEETMFRMEDNFVDMVITSPPYNIGKNRINGDFNTGIRYDDYEDDMTKEDYFEQSKKWINELLRVTKHHVFWNVQEVTGNKGIVKYLLTEFEQYHKETFIWAKTNPPPSIVDKMVGSGFEYIFCFSHDNPGRRAFEYCDFSNRSGGGKICHNVIMKPVNSGKENQGMSFAFPEWMPGYFIKHFSKKNDLIYDPFIGSGTTGKVAHNYERRWIGSEISASTIKKANKRIKKYQDQQFLKFK